ncbi:hypothetical protein CB0940_12192 [Cercospora beticola]|uniref:Uncharacterized protein n=1 Tax=Cercospora beticola TaxID=122368 RepID=A0A2G5GRT9_CERBT|nr:hypothetical protein CB0940_12192 [Cercospora beticola]PIA82980.1 hypothetical protein CB0940_12192 [Cercospora beticola]
MWSFRSSSSILSVMRSGLRSVIFHRCASRCLLT